MARKVTRWFTLGCSWRYLSRTLKITPASTLLSLPDIDSFIRIIWLCIAFRTFQDVHHMYLRSIKCSSNQILFYEYNLKSAASYIPFSSSPFHLTCQPHPSILPPKTRLHFHSYPSPSTSTPTISINTLDPSATCLRISSTVRLCIFYVA